MVSTVPTCAPADARLRCRSKSISFAAAVALTAMFLAFLNPTPAEAEFGFLSKWGSQGSGDGEFSSPEGVAADANGNVYVTDTLNNRIQKFDSAGNYLDQWGSPGSGIGQFSNPDGIAVDSTGNVYVTDTGNHRIQKFSSGGSLLALIGNEGTGFGQFKYPRGVAVDSGGNIYVVDKDNNRIQKFSSGGSFIISWGSGGIGDGQFNLAHDVTVDSSGTVYVADTGVDRIQKFGSLGSYLGQWGSSGAGDGEFDHPYGVAVDSSRNIYVADTTNHRIQKFDSNGQFITDWGSGRFAAGDGEFNNPRGVAVDSTGNVYVADTGNHRIQKFGESASSVLPPELTPPSGDDAYEKACNLTITSPKSNFGKSGSANVTAGYARRLFTHGVKGYIDWGQVNGQAVVCKNPKMTILERRGKRHYVPGTRIMLSKKRLSVKNFPTKGIRYLKKKKVGKLRTKSRESKSMTRISFKDFNRRSRIGRRSLNKLKKKRYRGTFVVLYTAEVNGVTVKKTLTLATKKSSKAKRK